MRLWKKEVIRPLILLLEAEIFYLKDARLAQLDFGAMHDRVDGCGGSVVGVELGLDRSEAGRPLCCRGILRRDFGKSSVKNVNLGPVPQAAKVRVLTRSIGARGPVSVPIRLQKEIEVLKKRPREKTDSAEITTDGSYIRPLDQSPIARSANL